MSRIPTPTLDTATSASELTGCDYCVAAHSLLGKPGEPSFYRSASQ
jgi:hypothetical protein